LAGCELWRARFAGEGRKGLQALAERRFENVARNVVYVALQARRPAATGNRGSKNVARYVACVVTWPAVTTDLSREKTMAGARV
jgi:hypothetical protein